MFQKNQESQVHDRTDMVPRRPDEKVNEAAFPTSHARSCARRKLSMMVLLDAVLAALFACGLALFSAGLTCSSGINLEGGVHTRNAILSVSFRV